MLVAATVAAVAVAAASPVPSATPLDSPPPGIAATSATLAAVLDAYKRSIGRPAIPVRTMVEDDLVTAFGLTGRSHYVESGDDYKFTETLGPMTTATGDRGGKRWYQNENGYTIVMQGVHNRDTIDRTAFERALVEQGHEGVKLVGEVSSPVQAYVVEITPQGGRHKWYFFEKSTGRLVRVESVYKDARVVTTFEDFRTTGGLTTAWHLHETDGQKFNDFDMSGTSLRYNPPVAPNDLDVPDSHRTVVEFPRSGGAVTLPARVEDGVIIVRVNVAGRGLDFQLDSGASTIVVDRDVARELGLKTYGLRTETVAGKFEASQAVIPEMDVAGLKLHNVVVQSLPFNYQWDEQTKVVGLLGYDFIAGTLLRVDYMRGTVTAYDPAKGALPAGESYIVPIALDDSVPMAGAKVGKSVGEHFILDTGAIDVMIFSDFANAHPDDVTDQGAGKALLKRFPWMDMRFGVGGEFEVWPTEISTFHFGAVNFQNFIAWRVKAAPSFEGEDADGLIGYHFLQYFDLYLDYENSRVILVPNALLRGS